MEYLIKWYSNTISYVKEIGGDAKKYIDMNKLDINTTNKEYMRRWIKNVHFS